MKKTPKFKIGNFVGVTAKVEPHERTEGEGRQTRYHRTYKATQLPEHLYGQVCGAAYRQEGEYVPAYGSGNYYDDGEVTPAEFVCDKTVVVYFVRLGMTNKPLEVFEKDMYRVINDGKLPWRWQPKPIWTDENRRAYREDAKTKPRGANGKFLKETKVKV
jgi:hypothetical protein